MFRDKIFSEAARQLACDYNCSAADFDRSDGRASLAVKADGQRRFTEKPIFFRAATFGKNAVISCTEEVLPFAEDIKSMGVTLFDGKGISAVNSALAPYGKHIGLISQYYLPKTPYSPLDSGGYHIELFNERDITEQIYPYYQGYENALMYHGGPRRDMLAVCALSGNIILGMAGASNDSDTFWQIGIDVIPEYRGHGLAPILVSILANEVFRQGAIPYYGTWPGNISSQKTALNSGFVPAWTEIQSLPKGGTQ